MTHATAYQSENTLRSELQLQRGLLGDKLAEYAIVIWTTLEPLSIVQTDSDHLSAKCDYEEGHLLSSLFCAKAGGVFQHYILCRVRPINYAQSKTVALLNKGEKEG